MVAVGSEGRRQWDGSWSGEGEFWRGRGCYRAKYTSHRKINLQDPHRFGPQSHRKCDLQGTSDLEKVLLLSEHNNSDRHSIKGCCSQIIPAAVQESNYPYLPHSQLCPPDQWQKPFRESITLCLHCEGSSVWPTAQPLA